MYRRTNAFTVFFRAIHQNTIPRFLGVYTKNMLTHLVKVVQPEHIDTMKPKKISKNTKPVRVHQMTYISTDTAKKIADEAKRTDRTACWVASRHLEARIAA